MFGHFTRDERNILLAVLAMLAAGFGFQAWQSRAPMTSLPKQAGSSLAQSPAEMSTFATGLAQSPPKTRGNGLTGTSAADLDTSASQVRATTPEGLLDLNRATIRHLVNLPGIGPAKARDIVEWRNQHGPFLSVDDLDRVPGIGPATLQRLRPLLTVVPASGQSSPAVTPVATVTVIATVRPIQTPSSVRTPGPVAAAPTQPRRPATAPVLNTNGVININTATAEQLEALDRVGPALARRIIEHRKVRGPFQSIEALVDVPGIGPKILERNRHRITVR